MSYHTRVKKYVLKVIRIRKKLIAEGKSKMNNTLAADTINQLEKYLGNFPLNKDYQMANFWRRNAGKILQLIPGQGSKLHDQLVNEFNDIDSITMMIDSPDVKTKRYVY